MPLLSAERNDRNEATHLPYLRSFTIGGDLDTYYPVAYARSNNESEARIDQVHIFRTFASAGPAAHGTHKAGLSSYWHGTDGAWDGGPSYWYCNEHYETYRKTLAAADIHFGSDRRILFMLRGGGYVYQMRSSCPFDITIYLTETQLFRHAPDGRTWFAVPRTQANISSVLPSGSSLGIQYAATTFTGSFRIT